VHEMMTELILDDNDPLSLYLQKSPMADETENVFKQPVNHVKGENDNKKATDVSKQMD
jgi:hypothetical protein